MAHRRAACSGRCPAGRAAPRPARNVVGGIHEIKKTSPVRPTCWTSRRLRWRAIRRCSSCARRRERPRPGHDLHAQSLGPDDRLLADLAHADHGERAAEEPPRHAELLLVDDENPHGAPDDERIERLLRIIPRRPSQSEGCIGCWFSFPACCLPFFSYLPEIGRGGQTAIVSMRRSVWQMFLAITFESDANHASHPRIRS